MSPVEPAGTRRGSCPFSWWVVSFLMKEWRPGEYVWPFQAHTVGLFTLHEDTSLIHGVLFVCERHRRFISCGFLLL